MSERKRERTEERKTDDIIMKGEEDTIGSGQMTTCC